MVPPVILAVRNFWYRIRSQAQAPKTFDSGAASEINDLLKLSMSEALVWIVGAKCNGAGSRPATLMDERKLETGSWSASCLTRVNSINSVWDMPYYLRICYASSCPDQSFLCVDSLNVILIATYNQSCPAVFRGSEERRVFRRRRRRYVWKKKTGAGS